ncbi:macrolide family glycosyltransferase [Streptomyces sp. NPDC047315]|uniref:macrolide family glycosyltransferase n=1 Tax=Streptomyces sp. NPDC047315 TaxID=3155142 RepID=UPI003407D209
MSKRLLFTALAGRGHVNPMLPLVEELVLRGHRVEYATSAPYAEAVSRAGARWVELPSVEPIEVPDEIGPDSIALWLRHLFSEMRVAHPVLLEHCIEEPPDAVCYDSMHWLGGVLSRQLAVPAVRSVPTLASNTVFSLLDCYLKGLGPDHPTMRGLAADCARFSAEYGVTFDPGRDMDVVEGLNLVLVPREFQPAGDTFDGRFHFVGPSVGRREEAGSWSPSASGRPLLYVSLGSVLTGRPEFYRACVDAFAGGPWQVAMTVGGLDPAVLGTLPPNIDARPWFPQPAVLRQADAFVTHAGMNSTMEGLYYGVGLVAVPHTPEQAVNARRLAELGLGEQLALAETTAVSLRSTVTRVAASAVVRANLERMRGHIGDSGGAVHGADLVEKYLC